MHQVGFYYIDSLIYFTP